MVSRRNGPLVPSTLRLAPDSEEVGAPAPDVVFPGAVPGVATGSTALLSRSAAEASPPPSVSAVGVPNDEIEPKSAANRPLADTSDPAAVSFAAAKVQSGQFLTGGGPPSRGGTGATVISHASLNTIGGENPVTPNDGHTAALAMVTEADQGSAGRGQGISSSAATLPQASAQCGGPLLGDPGPPQRERFIEQSGRASAPMLAMPATAGQAVLAQVAASDLAPRIRYDPSPQMAETGLRSPGRSVLNAASPARPSLSLTRDSGSCSDSAQEGTAGAEASPTPPAVSHTAGTPVLKAAVPSVLTIGEMDRQTDATPRGSLTGEADRETYPGTSAATPAARLNMSHNQDPESLSDSSYLAFHLKLSSGNGVNGLAAGSMARSAQDTGGDQGNSAGHSSTQSGSRLNSNNDDSVSEETGTSPETMASSTASAAEPATRQAGGLGRMDAAPMRPAAESGPGGPLAAIEAAPASTISRGSNSSGSTSTNSFAQPILSQSDPAVTKPPVKALSLKIEGDGGEAVNVRFTERQGQVLVSVRSSDPKLAANLSHDLNDLTSNLDKAGLKSDRLLSELASPGPNQGRGFGASPSSSSQHPDSQQSNEHSSNAGSDGEQNRRKHPDFSNQQNRRQRPNDEWAAAEDLNR